MRLPRFRLSLRMMMGAVAVVGIALGYLSERRARFSRLAEHYRDRSRAYFRLTGLLPPTLPGEFPDARYWRQILWAADHEAKYERARRQPWLPVAPDLPEP